MQPVVKTMIRIIRAKGVGDAEGEGKAVILVAAMAASSLSVVTNANRLRRWHVPAAEADGATLTPTPSQR
jgi:cation transport ATPase